VRDFAREVSKRRSNFIRCFIPAVGVGICSEIFFPTEIGVQHAAMGFKRVRNPV
jgi:hypothetical protein